MKRKTNINRPQISSDEINQRKNFDSVLKTHLKTSKPFFKKPWFLSSMVVASLAIVTTVILLKNKSKENQPSVTEQIAAINTNSEQLADFYKQEEAKPCIFPPIDGLDVNYAVYKIKAEKGGNFKHSTGSQIDIPKNAFVDDNGNAIKGDVEIRYREFHDMVDVFVAGIPMTYDSAGTRYHFESAGMLQIEGYQNGKKINIAPDKKIDVQLASKDNSTKYNLYELDTVKNNWSCLGKDKVKTNNSPSNILSTSVLPDSTKAISYNNTPEYQKIETQKKELKIEKEEKIAALPKLVLEAKKPQKVNTDKFTFNLEVSSNEFPELAVYKGVLFEVGDENKDFNKSMYATTWSGATIKEGNKKGVNYLLTLMKGNKKYDLIVYPVFEGKNYETALKTYQEKFDKYNVALEKRKDDEKRIEEEYQQKVAQAIAKQNEIERLWKEKENNRFKVMDTETQTRRMFAVSRFGVYNCDNPMAYPKGVVCSANLINDKKVNLLVYDIFLVDKAINGMFTFSKNPIAKFSYNPNASNILWTVENGVLYYAMPEDFNAFKKSNGLVDISLKRVTQKFDNVEDMKTFFKI